MKLLSILVALFCLGFLLPGCAVYRPTGAYGIYFENGFLGSCELRASVARCTCALGYLEQTVTEQQAINDAQSLANGYGTPAEIQTGINLCQWAIL
jgi:hypothetical protein